MGWYHKTSIEWMRARQRYLTATDIKALLPVTKTGRNRKITDEDYLKVLANKMVEITEDDCVSTGAMARGHLLEPFAVDALNTLLEGKEFFYHWDDYVYPDEDLIMAFSPDAMNITVDDKGSPTAIAEIKSYNPERHIVTAFTDKMEIEERWQIAVAMAVEPNVERGYLVLFNPAMKFRKIYSIRYSREDLKEEIEKVLEVKEGWRDFLKRSKSILNSKRDDVQWGSVGGSEETIKNKITISLNPA